MGLLGNACFGSKSCQQAQEAENQLKLAQAAALSSVGQTQSPSSGLSGGVIAIIVVVVILIIAGGFLLIRKRNR